MNFLLSHTEEKTYLYQDPEMWNPEILKMRKARSRISTIHNFLIEKCPNIDEIILLIHILDILNENNLACSRKEVRTAFNNFYHKEYHSDKQSYLNWLYREFKVKRGTITKPHPSKKQPVAVTSEGINACQSQKKKELMSGKGYNTQTTFKMWKEEENDTRS